MSDPLPKSMPPEPKATGEGKRQATGETAPRRLAEGPARDHLRLWLRMLRATRQVEAELRRRLAAEFDFTLPRFDVMAALYQSARENRGSGLTMTELSRRLEVSNGNVTGIVERLVSEGMVLRTVLDADRRAAMIRMTESGRLRFEAIATAHRDWVDELLAEVAPEEAVASVALFDRLLAGRST